MYTYIKQGTEITLNLKFEKIGLHVDTAAENSSWEGQIGISVRKCKVIRKRIPFRQCLHAWTSHGKQIIVMAHLMLLALIVKVCICKRISSMMLTITTVLGLGIQIWTVHWSFEENDLLHTQAQHIVIVKNDLIMSSCIFRLESVCTWTIHDWLQIFIF